MSNMYEYDTLVDKAREASVKILELTKDRNARTSRLEDMRLGIALRKAALAVDIVGKNAEEREARLLLAINDDAHLAAFQNTICSETLEVEQMSAEIDLLQRTYRLCLHQIDYLAAVARGDK